MTWDWELLVGSFNICTLFSRFELDRSLQMHQEVRMVRIASTAMPDTSIIMFSCRIAIILLLLYSSNASVNYIYNSFDLPIKGRSLLETNEMKNGFS